MAPQCALYQRVDTSIRIVEARGEIIRNQLKKKKEDTSKICFAGKDPTPEGSGGPPINCRCESGGLEKEKKGRPNSKGEECRGLRGVEVLRTKTNAETSRTRGGQKERAA